MAEAFICDALRTPIGRYGGALSSVRADDLGAIPINALMERNARVDWAAVSDVLYGCANQAGEDNRNVARMAVLLAGLPETVPGATVNRLCASGLEAVTSAARAIAAGDADVVVAGGSESMSRAPFVLPRPEEGLPRGMEIVDTRLGWRLGSETSAHRLSAWDRVLGGQIEQAALSPDARYLALSFGKPASVCLKAG